MADPIELPLFTNAFERAEEFQPARDSAYIFGILEERSSHIDAWKPSRVDVKLVELIEHERPIIAVRDGTKFSLRSRADISGFLRSLNCKTCYLDITGLSHHVWAPLLKVALETGVEIHVVYVEPANYRYSENQMKGEIFDLSEKIEGIEPLPQFAVLDDPAEDAVTLVALLGFEGARFAHMLEEIEPPGQNVVPVIGVPGFRLEYPFFAYAGNQAVLAETRSWHNVRFVRANCPFSLFALLLVIRAERPNAYIKIALVGTKPHSLGAILFAIASPKDIEIVYDHPKRKPKRTNGTMQCHVYAVSAFLSGNPEYNPALPQ